MRIRGEESRLVPINNQISKICFKATKDFIRGELIVEYAGDLVSREEGLRREQEYEKEKNTGCYMFYFCSKGKNYW